MLEIQQAVRVYGPGRLRAVLTQIESAVPGPPSRFSAEAVVLAFVGWAFGVLLGWLIYPGTALRYQ